LKALSLEYRNRIYFGEVRATKLSSGVISKYGVKKYPTLLVVKADGTVVTHTGGASHMSLSFFFDKFAAAPPGRRGGGEL